VQSALAAHITQFEEHNDLDAVVQSALAVQGRVQVFAVELHVSPNKHQADPHLQLASAGAVPPKVEQVAA